MSITSKMRGWGGDMAMRLQIAAFALFTLTACTPTKKESVEEKACSDLVALNSGRFGFSSSSVVSETMDKNKAAEIAIGTYASAQDAFERAYAPYPLGNSSTRETIVRSERSGDLTGAKKIASNALSGMIEGAALTTLSGDSAGRDVSTRFICVWGPLGTKIYH